MKRASALALAVVLAGCASYRAESPAAEVRGEKEEVVVDAGIVAPVDSAAVEILVETGDVPLGCYTVVLVFDPAAVRIVNIEGTEEFRAPDYSERTFHTGEVVLGAYQLQAAAPGRTAVARVAFESVRGGQSRLEVRLEALYDPDGVPIRGRASPSRTRVP